MTIIRIRSGTISLAADFRYEMSRPSGLSDIRLSCHFTEFDGWRLFAF